MKPRQRQAAILEHLQKQGNARLKNWPSTLTHDRQPLSVKTGHSGKCKAGTVIRTYGGVVLNKETDPRY